MMETHNCELVQTGSNEYMYYYGSRDHFAAFVTIRRTVDEKWFYTRLNDVSVSEEYDDLQTCIDRAYTDMLSAKL